MDALIQAVGDTRARHWRRLGLMLGLLMLLGAVWQAGLTLADEALPPGATAGTCSDWVQVNTGAFGMLTVTNAYTGEEGFEVLVFKDQLYVGMEADNTYGSRLWRTKAGVLVPTRQADWEEVASVGGEPFSNTLKDAQGRRQNDHIDSLAEFNGVLYASNANGGSSQHGTAIYSSTTGNALSWQPVITNGFGYTQNTNFKDMQVFDGWLCGGTQNWETGAQVWCTQNGATWTQKNHGGFGASGNFTETVEVWSGAVYSDALYFGAQHTGISRTTAADDVALLYRTSALSPTIPSWTRVYTGPAGSYRLDILGALDGYLYISHRLPGSGIVISRSTTANSGSWTLVNTPGMDNNTNNTSTVVDGATVYNGALYVAVSNVISGVQVWRTTGGVSPAWEQVGGSGLGDAKNIYAELITFRGYLYAWTSNYISGQAVLRTGCPIVQQTVITGAARFDLPPAAVALDVTAPGTLVSVTAAAYPFAFPTAQTSTLPLMRYVHLTAHPATATFTATLIFTYTQAEFDASNITQTASLYLTQWTGSAWTPCPSNKRSVDVGRRTVSCEDVTAFSPWAIAGEGGIPSALRVVSLRARAAQPSGVYTPIANFTGLALAIIMGVWRLVRKT